METDKALYIRHAQYNTDMHDTGMIIKIIF